MQRARVTPRSNTMATTTGNSVSVPASQGQVLDRSRDLTGRIGGRGARVDAICGGSGLASAPDPQPKCPVCGGTIISGDIVIFNQGELIHLDCHWDPPLPRRPLSRAMLWPR